MPGNNLHGMVALITSLSKTRRFATTDWFDPASYVRVVNQLLPEGKDAIITAIKKYRAGSDTEGSPLLDSVDLLLRILFKPPLNHSFQPQASVLWMLVNPINRRNMPSFPVAMIDDIPINGVLATYAPGDGIYGGHHKRDFLEDVRKYGVLRTELLKPPSHPLRVFEKALVSDQWYWSKNCLKQRGKGNDKHYDDYADGAKQDVMRQLLRMVRNVYPPVNKYTTPLRDNVFIHITPSDWNQCYNDVAKLNIEWNMQRGQYHPR